MTERLIRIREVMDRTGLSRTVLYRKVQHGDFPPSVKLTTRCVAWRETEVDEWINERIHPEFLSQTA